MNLPDLGWLARDIAVIAVGVFVVLAAINKIAPNIFTAALQQGWATELEQFKSSLQGILEKNKILEATLHTSRAELIAELYAKLLAAWWAWESSLLSPGQGTGGSGLLAASAATSEFREVTYRSRLYLTTRAIELTSRAHEALDSIGVLLDATGTPHVGFTDADLFDAYSEMDAQLRSLLSPIEDEFRRILRAEDTLAP